MAEHFVPELAAALARRGLISMGGPRPKNLPALLVAATRAGAVGA